MKKGLLAPITFLTVTFLIASPIYGQIGPPEMPGNEVIRKQCSDVISQFMLGQPTD